MYAHDASAGPKHDGARALVEEIWRDRFVVPRPAAT
jgi:hypothetical protein